jgi:hypothetical protein
VINEFKDKDGNRWPIELPIGTVLRVKRESEGKINLLDPQQEGLADRIASNDFETLYEALWLILRPIAEERKIDAVTFGQLIAADCIQEARKVLWRVWIDFFHQLQRPDQAAALERLEKYNAKALELVKAKLASPELEAIDRRVATKMETTLNQSFGSLQESLASILGPSPSESFGE